MLRISSLRLGRSVERKRTVIEVSEITFTVVKSRGQQPRETKCNGRPVYGYTPHGINLPAEVPRHAGVSGLGVKLPFTYPIYFLSLIQLLFL
jgi:hypothetical protein